VSEFDCDRYYSGFKESEYQFDETSSAKVDIHFAPEFALTIEKEAVF
jgi:hypothetical protein